MRTRKLLKEEHGITRPLWEEIFTEDDASFLNYYYQWKTAENEIYVIEDKNLPVSMLQLNPYMVRSEKGNFLLHYIIAVATKKEYRKKGYMTELLTTAAKEMYKRKEPFTFLMPAAEDIYYPHGFRFIYKQKQCRITLDDLSDFQNTKVKIRYADISDGRAMADFAEGILGDIYQVRTVRTEGYYHMLMKEQQSEYGGMLLLEEDENITGMAAVAFDGNRGELREPLLKNPERIMQILTWLKEKKASVVSTSAVSDKEEEVLNRYFPDLQWKQVPVIMARAIHLETFLGMFVANRDFTVSIFIQDTMLLDNTGVWKVTGRKGENLLAEKSEIQDGYSKIRISDLVTVLFGYNAQRDREKKVYENLPQEIQIIMESTEPLSKVFLNEIV
nr:GNAT family N-acetyltransferase [uncultured Sellimonas sp.]